MSYECECARCKQRFHSDNKRAIRCPDCSTLKPEGEQISGEAVEPRFKLGDRVRKIKGSSWQGVVVGFYSTKLTPIGYNVESEREPGSVQLCPEAALEPRP